MPGEIAAVQRLALPNISYLITGVGTRNAERAALQAISQSSFDALLHIGFAGALSPALAVGDILFANAVAGPHEVRIDLGSPRVAEKTHIGGVNVRVGTFVTRDRVLTTSQDKREVAATLRQGSLGCADMESAPVARICAEHGISYMGLRCITDTLDEDLPLDLNACRDQSGNIATGRVIWALARKPTALPGLMELRRRARNCAAIMARVISELLKPLPSGETDLGNRA